MRTGMTWFTRITSASSKKIENRRQSLPLHFVYCCVVRVHKSLKVSLETVG
jgi:hypothetical protein